MANSVTVVGSLQGDPELSFTKSGKALAKITVRDTVTVGDERTYHYYDVTLWNDLAEHVAASLEKGDRVIVVGKLEQQKWEDQEGKKHSKVALVAWNVGPDLSYADASVVREEREEATTGVGF